jgi:hypothetical protein
MGDFSAMIFAIRKLTKGVPPPPGLLESWSYSHTTLKIFEE